MSSMMRSLAVLFFVSFAAIWAQNVTVQVGAKTIGTRGALNLEPGFGVVEVCRDEGATNNRISCTPSFNSALIATHDTIHGNESLCLSSNGSTQYSCKLPFKAASAYQTGMTLVLVANAVCSTACSLNVDSLGPVALKKSDGVTDPGGALAAGEPQWVFYDGRVFRLMGGAGPQTPRTTPDAGERGRDVTARRFIAAMETIPYAGTVTLETTAGDVHKTTTNNAIGNATVRAATGGLAGQHMFLIIVNDLLSGKTITFGEHLRAAGTLTGAPGKATTLQFVSDGTVWYEVARTTNL
jgi:hypothetical protein